MIEMLLYTRGIEPWKEVAVSRWLEAGINELNRKFTMGAMKEWKGEDGDYREFIDKQIGLRWYFHCMRS